ncbi:MAG TPA: basic amino acid/polyamine antiporter, partial [Chloroflexota bacterium]|nr:basic amino acid/polyamine antiporter [Chloroflexota bacterium]
MATITEVSPHATTSSAAPRKLALGALTALVIGSMIGSGVFSLPQNMAAGAAPLAIIIGWGITAVGMLALAFVYQGLSMRQPALDAGPYAYARAGFGPFIGFNSAWGYWLSAWIGNVSYAVIVFSALSYFYAPFGDGNTWQAVLGASILLWVIHGLILSGIRQAAFVNLITTIAKVAPIVVFIGAAVVAFKIGIFNLDFSGLATPTLGSVFNQVQSTMLVTLWVFIGIEAASVYSARAANRADIGRATLVAFAGTFAVYVLVSLLARGVMTQAELAGLKVPSMAGALESIVGPWGAALINLGLIVSVGGAFLAWTLLCAEIPYTCGKDGTFPKWFAGENANGSPANSLWVTNGLIQLFLVLSLFSPSAYHFFYSVSAVAILPPYVFSGAYALKLALAGETYAAGDKGRRGRDIFVGAIAMLYGLWLVYAAGVEYLLTCMVLFVPGIAVYAWAQFERKARAFTAIE